MGTLYEIAKDLETVIDGGLVFDEETGEVVWDAESLDELEMAYSDKLEACGLFIKNLRADADAIKAEEERLAKRRKAMEAKEEKLRRYVAECMIVNGDKVRTPRIAMSARMSEAVEIDEDMVSFLPKGYVNTTVAVKPDKAKIKKALKDGEHIEGAGLVYRPCLVVR